MSCPRLLSGALALLLALCPLPPGARATGEESGQILGITIEPDERNTRLTIRCSAPAEPVFRTGGVRAIRLTLPGIRRGFLPKELSLDVNGIRSLRARQEDGSVRLELQLRQALAVRLLSPRGSRDVVLLVGPAPLPEAGPAGPGPAPPSHPAPSPEPRKPAPREAPVSIPPGVPRLVEAALVTRGARAQVRLRVTGPARIRHGFLPGASPRLYIDVEGALPDLAEPAPAPPAGSAVVRVRVGRFRTEPPVSRVVLDLRAGTRPDGVALPGEPLAVLLAPGGGPARSGPAAPPSAARPSARGAFVVAVDAGHGGRDPGASGHGGLPEKRVSLDVALRLARFLAPRVRRVSLSRSDDRTLPPARRAAWVRLTPSDVLVSIHCDSIPARRRVHGVATYFHAGHAASRRLAQKVQQRLVRVTRTPDLGVRADTTRFARGFYLLRGARRPAVLVEIGYLSHPGTAARLARPDFRQRVAEGIGSGVLDYLNSLEHLNSLAFLAGWDGGG